MNTVIPHVRWMISRDMDQVLAINKKSGGTWNKRMFQQVLRQNKCIGMVADLVPPERPFTIADTNNIIAFMVYELQKDRLDLRTMAVAHDHRRRGIGRLMIDKLVGKLSSHRRETIRAELCERTVNGQLFLKALGFRVTRIEHGQYLDRDDAIYVMEYRLAGTEDVEWQQFNKNRLKGIW